MGRGNNPPQEMKPNNNPKRIHIASLIAPPWLKIAENYAIAVAIVVGHAPAIVVANPTGTPQPSTPKTRI